MKKEETISLTYEEIKSYKKQEAFYISKKEFNTDKNDKITLKLYYKVRYHCHYTGKYRGAAHNTCNLRYKTLKEILHTIHIL